VRASLDEVQNHVFYGEGYKMSGIKKRYGREGGQVYEPADLTIPSATVKGLVLSLI
jgi:hypothetical protein